MRYLANMELVAESLCGAFPENTVIWQGMFFPDSGPRLLSIPDPRSRVPDPTTATKVDGGIKCVVLHLFAATNITKL